MRSAEARRFSRKMKAVVAEELPKEGIERSAWRQMLKAANQRYVSADGSAAADGFGTGLAFEALARVRHLNVFDGGTAIPAVE